MASPITPRNKRLAVTDVRGNRASSTPPDNKDHRNLLLLPVISPSSRHSSPGIERLFQNGRRYDDDLIPRRLTASPAFKLRDKDRTRKRLTQYQTVDHAVELLKSAKSVVVLTGAGISTSLNIPDFRSNTGFYNNLSSTLNISKPEEFFSIDFFKLQSEAFWDNVKPLLPRFVKDKSGNYTDLLSKSSTLSKTNTRPQFSSTHAFLSLLQSKRKLLTNYTQNVDGLELAAGLKSSKLVQCHGTWDTATCLSCGKTVPARKYLPIVYEAGYPRCKCAGQDIQTISPAKQRMKKRGVKKRKRAVYEGDSDHTSDDGATTPRGLFKPDCSFFGEPVSDAYAPRLETDKEKIDLLIIMGTSLKVRPIKTMVVDFPPNVPQIWINKERFSGTNSDMPGVQVDIELLGECDLVVEELCRRAGWGLEEFSWKRPNGTETNDVSQPLRQIKNDIPIRKIADLDDTKDNSASNRSLPQDLVSNNSNTVGMREDRDTEPSSKPVRMVKTTSDLDAEWRWRFTKIEHH